MKCKYCGNEIIKKWYKIFCCKDCRRKWQYHFGGVKEYSQAWQRNKIGEYQEGKLECPIYGIPIKF